MCNNSICLLALNNLKYLWVLTSIFVIEMQAKENLWTFTFALEKSIEETKKG